MKTPNFLRNLLQSNNYWDKNSTEFAKANEYLGKLFPGSAGCIDLTSGMDDFAKWFKTNGKDLIIKVEY